MTQTASQIIGAMADLLAEPESWTKGTAQRDAEGKPIRGKDDVRKPVCWCLAGALGEVSQADTERKARQHAWNALRDELAITSPRINIVAWNDHTDTAHKDVLVLLYAAKKRVDS